jgi:hypothetical protein
MVMKIPSCPNHGRLVLDLAQGRLDDSSAAEAETVRSTCPECSEWWRNELEGDLSNRIDRSVEAAFESFRPATHRRRSIWMPAAAAAALVVGGGLLWHSIDQGARHTVARESFDGDVDNDGVVTPSDLGFTVHTEPASEAIFDGNLDSGDLSGWTSKT